MGRDTEKRPRHLPGRHSGLVVGAHSGARRQVEVARVGPCWRRRAWRVRGGHVAGRVRDGWRRCQRTGTRSGQATPPRVRPARYPWPMTNAAARRPLKVGIQLPEVEREVRWSEILDMTRAIEDLGFDSVWVGEHLLYRWPDRPARGPWEAWTLLAAIAATTTRIELGPLVACTNFHNPALLAKQAATIDEISGGRFVLGLGAGWNETEFRAFGYPYDHRIDRFEEAFTIIRTLLREGAIDFDGRWYQARDCELLPRGPRADGPPLMIGSNGPRMLRTTMAHADSWNSWYNDTGNRPEGIASVRALVDAACRDVGRDPTEVERTVAVLVRLPGGEGRLQGDSRQRAIPPVDGDPAALADALRAFARQGIDHVQLVLDPITRDSIEAVAGALVDLDDDGV